MSQNILKMRFFKQFYIITTMNKKTKILGGIATAAIGIGVGIAINVGVSTNNANTDIFLAKAEVLATCESIGWWNNDGNCVHNNAGDYFCKKDTWYELTDCLQ